MKFNRSTGYGLLAVDYIAKNPDKTIMSHTIAEEYSISLDFLQKILQQLVSANILRNKRCPNDFSLAKPAGKISMLEIIEAIEGPIFSELYSNEFALNDEMSDEAQKKYEKRLVEIKNMLEKTKVFDML